MGYYHSQSEPGYWKNDKTSRSRYVRDDSRFVRSKSINRGRSQSQGRFQSKDRAKSQERPKSDLFKKVEEIEKNMVEVDKVKKDVKQTLEMLKKSLVNMKFVEEVVVDVKFVSQTGGLKMIEDSSAPLTIVSERWMKKYIEVKVVDENELEYRNCVRRFRFGENIQLSMKEGKLPIVVKMEDADYMKREVVVDVVGKEELLLCVRKTLTNQKTVVFFVENRLEFIETKKRVNLELSTGGHMLIKLEKLGEWTDQESVFMLRKIILLKGRL